MLTAKTRPAASFEGKPLTANCRIPVTFQIKDRTRVAAEGASLDRVELFFKMCIRDRLSGVGGIGSGEGTPGSGGSAGTFSIYLENGRDGAACTAVVFHEMCIRDRHHPGAHPCC